MWATPLNTRPYAPRLGGLTGGAGCDNDRARRVVPWALDAREAGLAQLGQVRVDAAGKAVAVQELFGTLYVFT